jgi:hypothetical protein
MPWLTWPYALGMIGEQGRLSGPVVVRTVVSVRRDCSRDVSGGPLLLSSPNALSVSSLITQEWYSQREA